MVSAFEALKSGESEKAAESIKRLELVKITETIHSEKSQAGEVSFLITAIEA